MSAIIVTIITLRNSCSLLKQTVTIEEPDNPPVQSAEQSRSDGLFSIKTDAAAQIDMIPWQAHVHELVVMDHVNESEIFMDLENKVEESQWMLISERKTLVENFCHNTIV